MAEENSTGQLVEDVDNAMRRMADLGCDPSLTLDPDSGDFIFRLHCFEGVDKVHHHSLRAAMRQALQLAAQQASERELD